MLAPVFSCRFRICAVLRFCSTTPSGIPILRLVPELPGWQSTHFVLPPGALGRLSNVSKKVFPASALPVPVLVAIAVLSVLSIARFGFGGNVIVATYALNFAISEVLNSASAACKLVKVELKSSIPGFSPRQWSGSFPIIPCNVCVTSGPFIDASWCIDQWPRMFG